MPYHIPVLLEESINFLAPRPEGFWIDATCGGGGHSLEILKKIAPGGKLIVFDRDEEAIEECRTRLKEFEGYVIFAKENFSNIKPFLESMNIGKIDGILFDLGVSSRQIDDSDRGFSFMKESSLDMRMDKSRSISAKEIINNSSESELERIIKEYGEERNARSIAKKIFREKPLMTTLQLAQIVKRSVPPKHYMSSAARVFQAFRIAVNSELEELETALNKSIDILEKGARIVVISYHSLEDRTVKKIFRKESLDCICDRKAPACTCDHKRKLNILTKKPVCAGIEEIGLNSRARSAKLRAAERD